MEYEYFVEGRSFRGKRISFHEVHGHGFSEALAGRYPVGTSVEVAHHPARPELSVLEPGASWLNFALVAVLPPLALNGTVAFAAELARRLRS